MAVVGTGYYGGGLLRRLAVLPHFSPRVAVNRSLDRALSAFGRAGIVDVVTTDEPDAAQAALDAGRYVASTDPLLPTMLRGIDVIAEATGDLLVGATVAQSAIEHGQHLVAANSDVQATVGPRLKSLADRAGVVYTDIEGDEPGLLSNLYSYCLELGLEVVVAGNGKGVLKRYATPATQAAFASAHGLQPWLATAAADGTKLNLELTTFANSTSFVPAVPGMHGLVTDWEYLVDACRDAGLLGGGRYVDYALGGRGVFVVIHSEDPIVQADFEYVKLGGGPYYVLHHPYVLVHYEAPRSIARAVRDGLATVAPRDAPTADTIAFAKQDLEPGKRLDGIGGFDTYGLIVRADEARRDRLLPVGLAQYGRLRRKVQRDEAIDYDAIEFEGDNLALKLRREQDLEFGR
ncbi:MAG: NAD(P)-dependent oxidoreductase [Chloroflexi bacterium]|nr:NAD(P)-dependent oxidoreductase [Chloroflexota bacterium]